MSHAATDWALALRGLKPFSKVILLCLAHHHNGKTGQCNPRQSVIADSCGMSRATVNRQLEQLEKMGLLQRVQRYDMREKKRVATQYNLNLTCPNKPMSQNETQTQHVVGQSLKTRHSKPENLCLKNGDTYVSECDSKNTGIEQEDKCDDKSPQENPFYILWGVHPRPRAKVEAEKLFDKALAAGTDVEHILGSAKIYAAEQKGNPVRYVTGLDTWLKGRRWLDYPPPGQKAQNKMEVIDGMIASDNPAVREHGLQLKRKMNR